VPILVKCNHTQVINNITSFAQTDQTKRDGGITPPKKGKVGGGGDLSPREYFINISEKCNLWIIIYPKFPRDGNESPSG
jgi:hypothetical protein